MVAHAQNTTADPGAEERDPAARDDTGFGPERRGR